MSELRAVARGLFDLVRDVLSRYGRLGGSQFAAAISYRALFSLVPLATFVATILAQVLSSSSSDRQDLVSAIADQLDLSAVGAAKLDALIASVPSPWSLAGVAALGLALWGATGVMSSMQRTLAVVFDQGASRGLIRGRLVSALLVLGALALVLLAVIVSMLENVARKVNDNVGETLGWQPFGFGILPASWCPRLWSSSSSCCSSATCPTTAPAGALPYSVVPSRPSGTRRYRSVSPGTSPDPPTSARFTALRVRSSPSSSPST
jgi:uncharacterized BrkB/YihY/UPF0761 family membrane protein